MSLELFLQNLGMYSAQIAVLVGAASALVWLARLESPRALLGLRQALLALCVLLPLLQTWRVPMNDGGVEITQSAAVAIAPSASSGFHISWTIVIAGVLAAGGAMRMLWLFTGICRLAIYRRRARRYDEPYPEAEIYLSDDVSGPVTLSAIAPLAPVTS